MKILMTRILALSLSFFVFACTMVPARASVTVHMDQKFSDAELDELLAPIALYPDPLLAQVIPASTFVEQLEDAQRTLNGRSDDNLISNQNWDVCVNAQTTETFQSPDDAVKGLVAAARAKDQAALDRILAPHGSQLRSGDSVQEAAEMARFAEWAGEKTELTKIDETRYQLELGNEGWPFPVPIVKRGNQWAFDSDEG